MKVSGAAIYCPDDEAQVSATGEDHPANEGVWQGGEGQRSGKFHSSRRAGERTVTELLNVPA